MDSSSSSPSPPVTSPDSLRCLSTLFPLWSHLFPGRWHSQVVKSPVAGRTSFLPDDHLAFQDSKNTRLLGQFTITLKMQLSSVWNSINPVVNFRPAHQQLPAITSICFNVLLIPFRSSCHPGCRFYFPLTILDNLLFQPRQPFVIFLH